MTLVSASGMRSEAKFTTPCYVMEPYEENPAFVGRTDVLQCMHDALAPKAGWPLKSRVFVLAGLGGIGKTQTAVKYSFSHRDTYPVVLWGHADEQSKLAESFCSFAVKLGICNPEAITGKPQLAKQLIQDALKRTGRCIVPVHVCYADKIS
jgi:hypothetical protein